MTIQKAFGILIALIVLGAGISAFMWNVPIPVKPASPAPSDLEEEAKKDDLIALSVPFSNTLVSSPITLIGKARGMWYFEASFPVELHDSNGTIIATSIATAEGEWMTEDFVPFTSTLIFDKPATDTGVLVLKKDNPSGDPERDDSLILKVRFR